MSVNFYDTAGFMVGVDLHEYFFVGGTNPIILHAVGVRFFWLVQLLSQISETFTTDGVLALDCRGHGLLSSPARSGFHSRHHTGRAGVLALTTPAREARLLEVHKVHVGGDKAATCSIRSCRRTKIAATRSTCTSTTSWSISIP